MCYGPCIQYLWCAQTCSRRPRWSCDLEVIWLWTYCYEALKEVSWTVCITKSLAMGLLWSVCVMLCNYETPDIDCSIWCYLWDYCATHSFVHVPLSHTDQWHFWTIQPMNGFGDMLSDCCKGFLRHSARIKGETETNLPSCRWNEHCLCHGKPFQLRPSHLHYALYFVPDLSP